MLVSGRLPSSFSSVTVRLEISLVSLFSTAMTVVMGTISWSKRPPSGAAAVRCWLISEYSSCFCRLTP